MQGEGAMGAAKAVAGAGATALAAVMAAQVVLSTDLLFRLGSCVSKLCGPSLACRAACCAHLL